MSDLNKVSYKILNPKTFLTVRRKIIKKITKTPNNIFNSNVFEKNFKSYDQILTM